MTVQGPIKKQQPDGMSHRGGGGGAQCSANHPCHHRGAHHARVNHEGARATRGGAHDTRGSHEGARDARRAPGARAHDSAGDTGGGRPGQHAEGVERLGLTHTETRRGMWWTTRLRRGVGSKHRKTTPTTPPSAPTTGLRERGNDTSGSTGRSGRQNAATRRNMRREDRVTVQGPVREPTQDDTPPQRQPQPRQTEYWALRARTHMHRPHGRADNDDPTQHGKGRTGDCPGPRKETTTHGGGRGA